MPEVPDRSEVAPVDVQRALMDRARRQAERHGERPERPLLPRLAGLALALIVVAVVLFAFDRFLASMQRFLALPVVNPTAEPAETIPAYVVPLEPPDGDAIGAGAEAPQAPDPPQDAAAAQSGAD